MRFLGERLSASGWQVVAVQLAGHGTAPEDLARCSWRDWYASIEDALLTFATPRLPAVVVGQSLGGLLALQAAAECAERVGAAVVLAPALELRARWLRWIRPFLRAAARWRPFWPKNSSDIADAEARKQRLGYAQIPVRALAELLELQRQVRRNLHRIRQPVLAIQSIADHTCSWHGIELLRAALSERLEVAKLEKSFHVISVDVEREIVAELVTRFVRSYEQKEASERPESP
jgi:carboxylesterase